MDSADRIAEDLSFDEFDEQNRPPVETTDFDALAEKAISRRHLLGKGTAFGLTAFVLGSTSLPQSADAAGRLIFDAVVANNLDTVTVPKGYNWHVVAKWGEPLWSDASDFNPVTRGNAASQARAFGDNTDGMELFAHDGKLLLAVNNEYTNRSIIWGNRPDGKAETDDDVIKGKTRQTDT